MRSSPPDAPLDNGQLAEASIPARYSAGQLDQLPAKLVLLVLLQLDIPSLICLRRVNRRAMQLVGSVPQYAALVRHCPNIIRAILSIQADAFNCDTLYKILSTTRCSTCNRFGDHLYLIDCRRVCYIGFTRRLEYFPLTIGQASSLFTPNKAQKRSSVTARQLLYAADLPSVLSLPGSYCTAWRSDGGNLVRKRLQLFDRRAVAAHSSQASLWPLQLDKTTRESRRFMAIITAPYLLDAGRQADWGCICLGCKYEADKTVRHFRTKFTRKDILEHVARHGPVREMPRIPDRFMHSY